MKVALFGGRFDPVHNGHLAVAREVLKVKAADEVWFSLDHQHQWRPIVAPAENRKHMLELAIGNELSTSIRQKFKVDETPLKIGGVTETISVIRELRKHIKTEIVFVVGSDQISTFHKWTHWEELEKELTFLIVLRKGSPVTNIPKNCIVIDDPNYEPLDDSATRIREKIKNGESISDLVPKSVEEYIIRHGLYK